MNKHTPAPWEVKTEPSAVQGYTERNVVFPGYDGTANGRPKAVDPFVIATVNCHYFGPHEEEPAANARLISVAPEVFAKLLEARNIIKALLQVIDSEGVEIDDSLYLPFQREVCEIVAKVAGL